MYKGGGKCVRHIVDPKAPDANANLPRELYRQRITNFEKTREKHKELHPPMAIPKNKPLTCGKFFVQDIICCSHEDGDNQHQQNAAAGAASGCRKCAARCASPERNDDADSDSKDDVAKRPFYRQIHSRVGHSGAKAEPPPTAEYVASPQWREHSPHKWLDRHFAATTASATATVTSISGEPYRPSVLIADKFAARIRGELAPTSPAVRAFEHERRVQTAALALRAQRSPQRAQRNYFRSMWAEPPPSSAAAAGAGSPPRSSVPSTRVGGRDLVLTLREQARGASSPSSAGAALVSTQ